MSKGAVGAGGARPASGSSNAWIDQEVGPGQFEDVRLDKRFRTLLEQVSNGVGESIPLVCQDWANTKAAYRFLSNERVSEEGILAGHFEATRDRFRAQQEPILILHDTTQFSFQREDARPIGVVTKGLANKDCQGRPRLFTTCGLLMHASLAVTTEGLPLGLAAVKFWTRQQFKGTDALSRKIKRTRVPIEEKESVRWLENVRQSSALFDEPERCVHIGDRESDIYELFSTAQEVGTHFLVRTCVDRLASRRGAHRGRGNGGSTGQRATPSESQKQSGRVGGSGAGVALPLHPHPAAQRQAEALPGTHPHRPACPGTRHAHRPGENRLEIDHRLAGAFPPRGPRKVGLVRVTLED